MTHIRHYFDWSSRGRPWIVLYLVGVIFGLIVLIFGGLMIAPLTPDTDDTMLEEAFGLLVFAPTWVLVPLFVRVALGRPGYSVGLGSWPPRLRNYLVGVAIGLLALSLIFAVYGPVTGVEYVGLGGLGAQNLGVLVLLIVGLVVQTGGEEILFRGFVTQATVRLFRRFTRPVVVLAALVLPSLWFAQLHINNIEEYGGHWTAGIPYFLLAVTFAWAAYRTGSIMVSMGLHVANNTFLVLVVTSDDDVLGGPAPFVTTATPNLTTAIIFAVTQTTLTVALAEYAMRRGWLAAVELAPPSPAHPQADPTVAPARGATQALSRENRQHGPDGGGHGADR